MARIALLAFQATSVLSAPPDERLLHPVPPARCHSSTTEIVVCGKDADAYRLRDPGPPPNTKGPPIAEWGVLGDAKISAHGTQRSLGPMSAPAAMVTITIPF